MIECKEVWKTAVENLRWNGWHKLQKMKELSYMVNVLTCEIPEAEFDIDVSHQPAL